ncbi:putative sugar phosphate isomerase/epimerase [Indibacter alkaliphilus LW1]|jgi:D-psicose/D-tagatose/L-ribulose 3-epimerase|uniref:Sugar phosphate isomerase/epimerase n=1 Tax=Indibacter alkaliphilus (strain CCUG 57479 / KCTC 22604 / LW1) TaxID=1189612 RepID=S2DQQ2_INDAL|nr:sugar phosphate isomerase/epimerase family protein [Indibacter alkaliphilus]EOZ92213.1 putative sugar phosphate isomerase/epimerase [Indibacter alkaliphilus LW1]
MSLNISFGVSTWLWTSPFNTSTLDLFPKIKSMGFDVVEIPVEDPALIDSKTLSKALEANGLQPVICGAFGPTRDLTHDDPSFHQTCFEYLRACFEISNALGANFVAGPMYSAVGKARKVSEDQKKKEWERAVNNLHKVCQMAEATGQKIALESLNRFETDLINTTEELLKLIEDINHPSAHVLMDGFHLSIEEKNLEEAIRAVGQKLIHVQVSENHRGIPGTGMTDWVSFRKGLEAVQYKGAVSIESFTPHVQELADAVCIWKPLAKDQDYFATEGIKFLKEWASQ